MKLNDFFKAIGVPEEYENNWGEKRGGFDELLDNGGDLPCFTDRYSVINTINTPKLIKEYIKHASEHCENDVLVFSVTERDVCWKAWADFHKAQPRTFKMVEGGSIHGEYMCRMYLYVKPKSKRKYKK